MVSGLPITLYMRIRQLHGWLSQSSSRSAPSFAAPRHAGPSTDPLSIYQVNVPAQRSDKVSGLKRVSINV